MITAIGNLTTALVALQAELPEIAFDSENPHFHSKFASLAAIVKVVRPLLAKHGLGWMTFPSTNEQGQPTLKYQLIHNESHEAITGEMLLMAGQNTAQAQGAAISYARRYALSAVLNIVTDKDDDGENANPPQNSGQSTTNTSSTDPQQSMPTQQHPNKATIAKAGDVCDRCKTAGFKSRTGYSPKFFGGQYGLKCNGVDNEGKYQNHPAMVDQNSNEEIT